MIFKPIKKKMKMPTRTIPTTTAIIEISIFASQRSAIIRYCYSLHEKHCEITSKFGRQGNHFIPILQSFYDCAVLPDMHSDFYNDRDGRTKQRKITKSSGQNTKA